jgi:hypothetical protein
MDAHSPLLLDDEDKLLSRSDDSSPLRTQLFPVQLYSVLEAASELGFEEIISWLPTGDGFRVHDRHGFEKDIMPRFFRSQSKYKSFLRQLNLYKFKRLSTCKKDRGCYHYQTYFVRGKPELCETIQRSSTIKGADHTDVLQAISSSPLSQAKGSTTLHRMVFCGANEHRDIMSSTVAGERTTSSSSDAAGSALLSSEDEVTSSMVTATNCDVTGNSRHTRIWSERNAAEEDSEEALALASDTLKKEQNTTKNYLLVSRSTIKQSEENDENKHPSGLPLLSVSRLLQPKGIHPKLVAEIISIFSVRDEIPLQITPAPCS